MKLSSLHARTPLARSCFREFDMKLPLIAASVVAYTVLALVMICYAGLSGHGSLF
ncbi:hypothetical protein PO883_08515 [Massilia sp. DJPM01]|uniref:hypothetical protein n=1 Tax=Massilia sp. DJPM01 TaxID=3024404 RepID=UPI00259FCABD|nr:hypothetical protein [Massilia sp. DJPM01]MDM5177237.1 hypothetical protein [Massilia sp. DJPM01]